MTLLFAANYGEVSGNVVDQSGNGRGFALTGTSVRTAAGGGYTYGGTRPNTKGITQTSFEIQNGPSITGLNTANRTLMTWAKIGGADPSWFLEYHRNAEDTGVYGFLYLSGAFTGRAKNSSNSVSQIAGTPDIPNWHHWALTYNGTTLRLFRDGTEVGSGVALSNVWAADVLRLFTNSGPSTVLSETRIYDTALDQATIATLKDTPVADLTVSQGYWGVTL